MQKASPLPSVLLATKVQWTAAAAVTIIMIASDKWNDDNGENGFNSDNGDKQWWVLTVSDGRGDWLRDRSDAGAGGDNIALF